ncbi:phage tail tape measure C-terminal domain-containing protein [Pseudomonas alloputida]|uniref:Phage tail tape measure C-terminal domain-containing protein n=1 Tax=Pseudomonas alloputida TaxID=1940621 RepID=A0AAW7HFI9_9PSED|nr:MULTISPECIES: phage tail tape measure C-terminal domain-containing protein [Pseudomonas]MCE0863408.1 tail tape measure protein [Pseudomonas alloputida]MCE0892476.1 tail tape measure protein [Pseudomonas alloputida]MCE0921493.1 tail tape measure protein [Pseudomonas alloputida]MCE1048724.1 tail tape measure protein [Pseudomonas alloputida]MCE1128270.1 tail tape measure protein [Pseudomonas alloputida]
MASRSLGTLTLDVIAQVGGFVAGMDKAERSSAKWRKEVEKSAKAVGTAVGAGVATAVTAFTTMMVSAVNSASEISNLAAVANVSVTDFQKMAVGAKTVGVEQDKLSDILKDVNDKVGDFLNTGGGGMADFFEQIAPKVGVTAEQFRNLSGSQALGLYVSSLEKAKVSQSEMTFYLEAIASDATALLPLLRNNSQGFKEYGDAAEAAGAVMDETTILAAKQFSNELTVLGTYLGAVKTTLAAEFMPVLAQLSKDLASSTKEAGGLKSQISALADSMIETVAVTASIGDGIARAFNITAQTLVGSFDTAMYYLNSIGAAGNDILGKITFGETSRNFKTAAENMRQDALVNFGNARVAIEEINKELAKPLAGDKIRQYVIDAKKAAAELGGGTPQPGTFTPTTPAQQEAAKAAEAAAKKLQGQFDTAEEGYKRQIALINTETDKRKEATEVAKLQFELESGNLTGLSAKQQERLKGLAAELDQLKQLKQAKEDDKAVAGFDASVKRQLSIDQRTLDAPLKNAYSSDEMKQRALDLLAIEQNYQDQLEDLRQRHDAGDVSDSVYERETEILNKALNDRKAMQEKYYQDVDAMQQNGTAGFISGFATQAQAAMDLYSNMQSVGSAAFSSLTDMLTEWAETGKLNAKDFAATFIQSIGHSLLAYAAAQVAMAGLNAFTAMIGVPFVGPAIAPGAAIAAAAAAGVLMTGVGSALSGQAHAGIDNIPSEGTWLLDGGERVLSPAQNRDLTGYLQRVNSVDATSKPGGGAMNVEVHNYAPAQVDVQQDGDRMKVFIREAKKQIAGDLARGNGDVSKALSQGWGVKRAAR